MTDPKLREARIVEAKRLQRQHSPTMDPLRAQTAAMEYLIDLIEKGWKPEPEVDAVENAFKVWADAIPNGESVTVLDAFRAGHAHALATCADVRRMDWLEAREDITVDLLAPGGFVRELRDADTLRTKIDRAMEQLS